jgi:hypothetical protein
VPPFLRAVGKTRASCATENSSILRRVNELPHGEVAESTVDLLLIRQEYDVGVNVVRRDGDVQILVLKCPHLSPTRRGRRPCSALLPI